MTLRLNGDGSLTVTAGEEKDEACLNLTQDEGQPVTLTVRNRPYTFRAVKLDGSKSKADIPLQNVTFALHMQHSMREYHINSGEEGTV